MHEHTLQGMRPRGGALRALVVGFFCLLTVIVVCTAGLGLYALNVVDRKATTVLDMGGSVVGALPEILPELQESLPPVLADALHDERRPDYRSEVDVSVRMASRDAHGRHRLVLEVENRGQEVLSMLAVRVVLVDAEETPVRSVVTYLATPLAVDHDWPGPLMPDSKRLSGLMVFCGDEGLTARAEITDLRLWRGPANQHVATAD